MKHVFAAVLLSLVWATPSQAGEITGYISDHVCAAQNTSVARATDWLSPEGFEACVKRCVAEGSGIVFVTEDNKMLSLEGASLTKVTPHVGQRVSVQGTVKDGALHVDTVTRLKMLANSSHAADADDHQHAR